jgi:hypothetical protein
MKTNKWPGETTKGKDTCRRIRSKTICTNDLQREAKREGWNLSKKQAIHVLHHLDQSNQNSAKDVQFFVKIHQFESYSEPFFPPRSSKS